MANMVFPSFELARRSLEDNKFTYTTWVKGEGAKTATHPRASDYLDGYARVAAFLCDPASFEAALQRVSSQLWDAYRLFNPNTRNKFTRALNKVASAKGFSFQNRFGADTSHTSPIGIKLIGGDPQLGFMLRNKLFWKDSMDLRHGEHTHSLQWLAIAEGNLGTVIPIADLYAETGSFRASSDADQDGKRSLLMWQWIADCFPTDMSNLAATFKGKKGSVQETLESQSYRSPQVITDFLLRRSGGPIADHFVSNYLFYRYKNRKWLTVKPVWNQDLNVHQDKLDKIYSGDPSVAREGSMGAKSWKKSQAVPEARLLRDPTSYVGKHGADGVPVAYDVNFHGNAGQLCYYYLE